MNGIVDDAGRALIRIQEKGAENASTSWIDVWIDTGFTGDLVLPKPLIDSLGLSVGSIVSATLGDGSTAQLNSYTCLVEWFGEWKSVEVIANQGRFPLLGYGLLLDRNLHIDYRAKTIVLS